MDRIKINTYYVWLSKTGFTHWILIMCNVYNDEDLEKALQYFKKYYNDVGQIFATINCPKEYLRLIDDDIYEFVQEQE